MKTFCASVVVIVILVCLCARPVWAESAEEWTAKGKEAYRAQNYDDADKYYSKALEIDPKMKKALFNRALNSYRLKKYKEARSDLSAVLDIDPKDHEAIFYTGLTYFGQGKYSEAYNQFDKAAEIERLPLYLLNAAAARYNGARYHATIQHCKMAMRLNPEDEIKIKVNELMTQAEEQLKEDKEKRIVNAKSSVRVEDQRPRRIIEVKWIQIAETSGGSTSSGGG
ncbi:MAG: tetratricopeptide repeat protein [Desulfomonilaceae bacterium]